MPEEGLLEEVEEVAGEKLGVSRWDRPAIFRETATAAVDVQLPFWLVLMLSGGIATLGLALNSSAVVIGAMLIAPLLAPIVGWALALAVGDSRLAIQTGLVVALSTVAVVVAAALVTVLLPYQTVTPEITARTRPNTLDLAIAIFSGLAGVLVTVHRGKRLSAAIPGVAIAVALIPPLAVAGFGIGAGWRWELIYGSMLLYGANLSGIVLSGMIVFMLIGMHRPDVLRASREWHESHEISGLFGKICAREWFQKLGLNDSRLVRIGIVVAIVALLAVPLTQSLRQLTREVRVRRAVEEVTPMFEETGRSSVLNRQVVLTDDGAQAFLRVATTQWYSGEDRDRFEREASVRAGEPITLALEQIPASAGDLEQFGDLLPTSDPRPGLDPVRADPARLPELLESIRGRLQEAVTLLPLPSGLAIAELDLRVRSDDGGAALVVAYLAARPLPPEAERLLSTQIASALDIAEEEVVLRHVPAERPLEADAADAADLTSLLEGYTTLRVELRGDTARLTALRTELLEAGVDPERIDVIGSSGSPRALLHVAPHTAVPADTMNTADAT